MTAPTVGDNNHVLLRAQPGVRRLLSQSLQRRLQRRAARMLRAVGLHDVELSVLLAGDETVADLNETYRDKKGTTDVLSFGQADPDELRRWRQPVQASEQGIERILGDIVISLPVVKKRSSRAPAFEADLTDLLAHGVLHLLGHDHPTAPTRAAMLTLQSGLVAIAKARGPVRALQA